MKTNIISVLFFLCVNFSLSFADIFLAKEWRFNKGDNLKWLELKFNDKNWQNIEIKKIWEDAGFPNYDGYGWYRIKVNIPSELKEDPYVINKKYLILYLGAIDDVDETFFNGRLIGKTGEFPPSYETKWAEERFYKIPVDIIKWDKDNVIAVRVYDGGGGGGLYKGTPKIHVPVWNDLVLLKPDLGDNKDGTFSYGTPMVLSCFISNDSLDDINGKFLCIIRDETNNLLISMTNFITVIKTKSTNIIFQYLPSKPGLYNVSFKLKTEDNKQKIFSMYYGYGLDHIDSQLTREKDFKIFWDKTRLELSKISPKFNVIEKPELSVKGVKVYLVEMKSLDDVLIRGWYSVPESGGPFPAILQLPGHSVSLSPVTWFTDFAVLALNIRGHGNSKDSVNPGFPGYLVYGLENEYKYIYRGAYMDCIRGVDFLVSRKEVDPKRIAVEGASQGGALCFVTAALDPRITLCAPDVPFLSDFKTYFKITGWPGFEFKNYLKSHPEFSEEKMYRVLSYFDIMNLAPWIKCPVFMSVGLQDRVCPPTINFAAFNKVTSKKEVRVYPFAQHEGGGEIHWKQKFEWIRKNFGMSKE